MSSGSKIANLPTDQLRAFLRACREEGVVQFASPELSFTLGPLPPRELEPANGERTRSMSAEEKLERDLFPE